MGRPNFRSLEDKRGIVARIQADMDRGTSTQDASEKEGINAPHFYKMRADLKKAGLGARPKEAVVKIINTADEMVTNAAVKPRAGRPRGSHTHGDKCVVIVTTSNSLRSVLEGVF